MRKPNVTRLRQARVPLFWERTGSKTHIGYYFPATQIICTPKGRYSEKVRRNPNGKMENENIAHDRRVIAAFYSDDFIYRDGMVIPEDDKQKKLKFIGGRRNGSS